MAIEFSELASPDPESRALFRASFNRNIPEFPRHFVARYAGHVVGYVHQTPRVPDIHLVGGLCVDARAYRAMPIALRELVRSHGSLSRWLLEESIRRLENKRAVFAYTGHPTTLRDCLALGFETTEHQYLIVQWHMVPIEERPALIARAVAEGPF